MRQIQEHNAISQQVADELSKLYASDTMSFTASQFQLFSNIVQFLKEGVKIG